MSMLGVIRDAISGLTAKVEARAQTPSGNALNVQIGPGDVISYIPITMEFEHHQVHEGESFKTVDQQLSLGSGTVKYGLTVPVYANTIQAPHLVIDVSVYNGAVRVDLYAEATFTSGSAMTVYNRNRNSSTAAGMTVKTGVTSTDGTLIDSFYVGVGKSTSGNNRSASEWVLKSNKIYRVDIIGQAAGTAAITSFVWYEDLGV